MDEIDRQIVALLRQDARRSFQSIGLRVSLSAPAVERRDDRLEAGGVLTATPRTWRGRRARWCRCARDTSHLEQALERIRATTRG